MKELVNLIKDNKVLFACVVVATCAVLGLLTIAGLSSGSETATVVEASDAGVVMSEDAATLVVDAGMTQETTTEDTGVLEAAVEEN